MSWPWKKKTTAHPNKDGLAASSSQKEKEICLKPGHFQVPLESYTRFVTLEDELKSNEERTAILEGEIKDLNEKLLTANSDLDAKEELVTQHAKVAEEAVNGWEKAEAEALALKDQLELVTLSKFKAEDRVQECLRETRTLNDEHEQRLCDVVFNTRKEFDQMKREMECRIADLDGELARATAENAALAKLLQERSGMVVRLSEDNAMSESRIKGLETKVESCEREIASLNYELHIAARELEIRTEEKNMSDRSADVANKQHVEAVKRVAKLEAECQKLRGLMRKRLPGPAALAQMKTEVESFERDYSRRLSFEGFNRETEVYTQRIFTMEEEIRVLKDALANKNNELEESQSRLLYLESHIEKNAAKPKHLEFMDDFLEMEKLAKAPSLIENEVVSEDIYAAVKKIHEFVLQINRGAYNGSVQELSSIVNSGNFNTVEFVLALGKILVEGDVASPDCIDKVALPSDDLVFNVGMEWKLEKEMMTSDLAKSSEDLEATRAQLHVAEQRLSDVETQLAAAVKANGLLETQVKCMAESYRALEARAALLGEEINAFTVKTGTLEGEVNEFRAKAIALEGEVNEYRGKADTLEGEVNDYRGKADMLEGEVNEYRVKADTLESELQTERGKNREEQQKKSRVADVKTKQDRELSETAEKLAECQQTILMLGQQLKAMQPQHELRISTEKTANSVTSKEDQMDRYEPSDGELWTPRIRSPMSRRHLGSPSSSGFIKLFRGKRGLSGH